MRPVPTRNGLEDKSLSAEVVCGIAGSARISFNIYGEARRGRAYVSYEQRQRQNSCRPPLILAHQCRGKTDETPPTQYISLRILFHLFAWLLRSGILMDETALSPMGRLSSFKGGNLHQAVGQGVLRTWPLLSRWRKYFHSVLRCSCIAVPLSSHSVNEYE